MHPELGWVVTGGSAPGGVSNTVEVTLDGSAFDAGAVKPLPYPVASHCQVYK